MSNITIKVDFLAGTSFNDSIHEAKRLARRMDICYVAYVFNGINVSIGQNADLKQAEQDFKDHKRFICHS